MVERFTTYRGRRLNLDQLAVAAGLCRNTIRRWRRQGVLSEAYIEAYHRESELRRKARELGISPSTTYHRIERGWDVADAYTLPLGTKGKRT